MKGLSTTKAKLWGPGFMREGMWLAEPSMGSNFTFFVEETNECINIINVRKILSYNKDGFVLIDDADRDFWVENV